MWSLYENPNFFDLNQPDIVNPENYPHVHPPPDLYLINEELPDDNEIKNAVSNWNNGKYERTDKLKAEHLKYGKF